MKRPLAYITAPWHGVTAENTEQAARYCRAVYEAGYTDATKITKRMVAELIDHIEVYPAVKEDGVTNQRVTIHYNCIGVFEVPDRRKIPERDILLETRRGVALSYAPAGIAV